MSILRWIVGLVVFVALLLLALQNAEPVTLHLYDDIGWQTPLIFLLLVVFGAGAIAGLLTGAMRSARLARQVARLRRERGRQLAPVTTPRSDAM